MHSEPWPTCLKAAGGLTSKPSEIQLVHTRAEGEDEKVWHWKWPGQGC